MNRPPYQLTRHSIGSLFEIATISSPLMLGLLSFCLMIFFDRLLIASVATEKVNVFSQAGSAYWTTTVFFVTFAETLEILVGKYNGAGQFHLTAKPVWQFFWMLLAVLPLYGTILYVAAPYFFPYSTTSDEVTYFRTQMIFIPFAILPLMLQAFFIGTGRTTLVSGFMVVANIVHIVLAYSLIIVLRWDVFGAALASVITNILMTIAWAIIFFSKSERTKYGTTYHPFDKGVFYELFSVATPTSTARTIECFSHTLFFAIMASRGIEALTCVTLIQTLFITFSFIVDGISKGASAIISNLVGGKRLDLVPRVVWRAYFFHFFCTVVLAAGSFFYKNELLALFIPANSNEVFRSAHFLTTFTNALSLMLIYFLLDGFCWILFGFFGAMNKTSFVLYVNVCVNWLGYILPTYILVKTFGYGGDAAWAALCFSNLVIFVAYAIRYRQLYASTQTA